MKKILVVGTTGPVGLGREICKILSHFDKQYTIRSLVRESAENDPNKQLYLEQLKTYGVTTYRGDLKDPQSLLKICEGMDVVITTATITSSRQPSDTLETVDKQGQKNLLVAAEKMGVKKYIYVSYSDNNQANAPCELTNAKRELEAALQASSLDYTILKPTYLTECWLSPRFGFDLENKTAALYDNGRANISWISIQNVAQYAVAAISNPKASRASLNLGGPAALSLSDIVKYCEQRLGCQFELSNTCIQTLQQALDNANASGDSLEQSLAALTLGFAKDDIIDMSAIVEQFTEIELISVEQIIDKHISS